MLAYIGFGILGIVCMVAVSEICHQFEELKRLDEEDKDE